jgi:glutamate carboxypeptidase
MTNRFNAENIDAAAMLAELRHWVELETPTLDAAGVNRLVDRTISSTSPDRSMAGSKI